MNENDQNCIAFSVSGRPQGKARPRVYRNPKTGKAHGITPEKTKIYEELVQWSYKAAGGKFLGDAQIEVHIVAYFKIPQSYTKKRKREILENGMRPSCKPDLDNIEKIILDALNGVAYKDDAQVIKISCEKIYSLLGEEYVYTELRW